jgi:HSP20 family protein
MTLSPTPSGGRSFPTVIRRWDPFREMEDVYGRMSMLMQDYFRDQPPSALADIEETDDGFIVELDLPGVRPDHINLELRDSELRLTGELKEREHAGVLRRKARRVGEFEHVIALPGEVDPEQVEATLHDGVLTVQLAKATANQPRKIEIKNA